MFEIVFRIKTWKMGLSLLYKKVDRVRFRLFIFWVKRIFIWFFKKFFLIFKACLRKVFIGRCTVAGAYFVVERLRRRGFRDFFIWYREYRRVMYFVNLRSLRKFSKVNLGRVIFSFWKSFFIVWYLVIFLRDIVFFNFFSF